MGTTRITIARPDIVKLFEHRRQRIYRERELGKILAESRGFWRLAQSETVASFIEFLVKSTPMKRVRFKFPARTELRYTWGEVPLYELIQSIRPSGYFSHYSAAYFHELTDQVPKRVYLNDEQTPKPAPRERPTQSRIDMAFRRKPRETTNVAEFGGLTIHLLSGKHTGQLGVQNMLGPDGAAVRSTDLERTLIDMAVRPQYAGGVVEVLGAYRAARPRVSVNRVSAYLRQLDYVYPYHQVIGFYLDRAGAYTDAQLRLFRRQPIEFDFYLCQDIRDRDYDDKWRLFFPRGL